MIKLNYKQKVKFKNRHITTSTKSNIPLPGRNPAALQLTPDNQQPSTAHNRRQ